MYSPKVRLSAQAPSSKHSSSPQNTVSRPYPAPQLHSVHSQTHRPPHRNSHLLQLPISWKEHRILLMDQAIAFLMTPGNDRRDPILRNDFRKFAKESGAFHPFPDLATGMIHHASDGVELSAGYEPVVIGT